MTLVRHTVHGRPVEYWLVEFDKHGNEKLDSGELASHEILRELKESNATDVFVISHGWKGSWEGAQAQYDSWVAAAAAARPASMPREVRPFVIGVQWPAQWFVPAGIDRDSAGKTLADAPAETWPDGTPIPTISVADAVDEFAGILGDTAEMRAALERALTADAMGKSLEEDEGAAAALDAVRTAVALEDALVDTDEVESHPADGSATLGGGPVQWAITGLRQLSFWTMKRRAYIVGASGVAALLRDLQRVGGKQLRLHVMGHSLGCIVVSSAIYSEGNPPKKPVSSMLLMQGALSLWAYADDAVNLGKPGKFRPIRDPRFVAGPIVTTQSVHDQAVGYWYPKSAGIAGIIPGGPDHRLLATDPTHVEYGALGAYGAQDASAEALVIDAVKPDTAFRPATVYNVDASSAIVRADGGDAHGDIASPATALLSWRTALSAP
jgi:hypothetical protein